MLHLLGFDHEISDEAEAEMEKEEELLLKSLGWKGKGLIQSAYDTVTNSGPHMDNRDGNFTVISAKVTTLLVNRSSSWTELPSLSIWKLYLPMCEIAEKESYT